MLIDMRAHNWADLTGRKFGKWTAVSYFKKPGKHNLYWRCLCECGRRFNVNGAKLTNGTSQCCRHCRVTRHGGTGSRAYKSWNGMMTRCRESEWYVRKGIAVCPDWQDFAGFHRDMGDRPEGMELDRIDNSQGYRKDNCRWANKTTNQRNRDSCRTMTIGGVAMCVAEAAERTGLSHNMILKRLNRGWSDHDAITKPARRHR